MKSIIITGASGGIGKATALAFLEAGWTVGLLARNAAKLDELAADHPAAHALPCDVTDVDQVEAAFQDFVGKVGHLDVLFNNAGRGAPPQTIDEMDPEVWKAVLDVNLTGMFLCARAAFRVMRHQKPQGGRIINNGSISAVMPRPGAAPYNATKHGVLGLTKTLSLDGRPFDIACGQIDIGNALTEMTARMAGGVPQADGSRKPEPTMDVSNVSASVLHMAGLPLSANVQQLTVMATKMPYIGRG
ncbi:SDR family oxidoreductase [Frigidibacter sp. ROC022]|uniref:SDR family oxidoreductase n=1 Tax=Frigidibacter sp. ROC022 TaxID=2971796 RepID=UPI00215B68F9|nr:SDR family oxidoreductase [Frigidibacter sp. ROC022]MCR8725941.1 SDR family oxidoreductase [Frigidibacter sp. ROC022]